VKVKSVERLPQSSESLYDLSVEKTHTYTVGESKVVVHNCGVGFRPITGILNGFMRPIPNIEIIRSTRTQKGGAERNTETWLSASRTWILQVGDSAEAWAKAVGKLISGKHPAEKLIIDLSQIRPAGERLRGYGWISSGDHQLYIALQGICKIMNRAAGRLLSELDILDIVNWMGTILSSRRSAELALMPNSNKYWREFALAKRDHQQLNPQRGQSNNSLVFYDKPSKSQLFEVFDLMLDGGGSEPGIVNGDAALRRAPYFYGMNPSLRAGTLVMTDHGIVPIESLDSKQFQVRNLYGEWQPATCWLSGRDKPLWEITLAGGHKIYATEEHKWPVVAGDFVRKVPTSELVAGMQFPVCGVDVLVDSDVGSYEDGFFCGWVFGDGWITYRKTGEVQVGLCVAMVDSDVLPLLTDKLKEFGCEAVFKKNKNANCYELMTSHSSVISLLSQYGFLELRDFGIPKSLFETTSEAFRRGFIDAMFSSGGCVESRGKKNGLSLTLGSSRREVVQSLSDLLGFYGIHSTIKGGLVKKLPTFPNGTVHDREYEYYSLIIGTHASMSRFLSLFKLTAGHKQRLLEQAVGQSTKPNMRKDTDLITIKSVVKTDLLEDVWDISVNDDTHCFQLAHCVTGNCGEILLGDKGFCVHGDTWLITREALVKISDVVGEEVEVWNGQQWAVVVPQITGYHQQMLRIELSDGSYLDCTPYHRLSVTTRFSNHYHEVMAKTVMDNPGKYAVHSEPFKMVNDSGRYVELAYELGFGYGDGYEEKDDVVILLYGRKVGLSLRGVQYQGQYRQNPDVPQRKVVLKDTKLPTIDEVFLWDRTSCLAFIAGLADSDGSNTESGGIRIYQSDEVFIRKLQLLLSKNGIRSSVCLMADVGQSSNFKRTKASWYVSITDVSELPCQRLNTKLGHAPIGKGKYQNIKRIYPLEGEYTSYCFEEPIQHKAVFNNMLTYQCNLAEVVLPRFNGNMEGLKRALYLIARANYRQSCVNLDDGLLQRTWHELNEYLHLCGVGLTGIVQWEFANEPSAFDVLHQCAKNGANSMADELDMEHPAAVTTTKPSGTLSKLADCTEGIHKPLGRYILNNINYSIHDPVVKLLQDAGYRTFINPYDATGILVTFPVQFANVEFSEVGSRFLNLESAVAQLERYKMVMEHYIDHNVSSTVSYSPGEIGSIVDWIHKNWDCYVSATFMLRNDPTKTAEDLGYPYLPQEVVTQEVFEAYANTLRPIDMEKVLGDFDVESAECAGGMCPIR